MERWNLGRVQGVRWLATISTILLCVSCSPSSEEAGNVVSHANLATGIEDEFAEICRAVRASEDPYYGRGQLVILESELAQDDLPIYERIRLQRELAEHRLRLGEPRAALALLNETLEFAASNGATHRTQIDLLARIGVAALRLGEVENCVDAEGSARCILPITEAGRHSDREGSELAMRAFKGVLAGVPNYPHVPWLLNIAAMTLGEFPDSVPPEYRARRELMTSPDAIGRFPNVAPRYGLQGADVAGGAVIDDFDGDGRLDLVTSSAEPCAPLRLLLQITPGRFTDATMGSGLEHQLGALNVIHADYVNDGDLDLFALRGGWMGEVGKIRNSLLRNDGVATTGAPTVQFVDITAASGLADPALPTQTAAWADIDLDGDLDLYIGNEGAAPPEGWASQLFLNDGDGTFSDISTEAGVENLRYAKSVTWGDYDDDGDPDLYVSNFGPNRLYRNDLSPEHGPRFVDVAPELGVSEPSGQSFGSWFFDYDNDSHLDLFVASYEAGPAVIERYFLKGRSAPNFAPRLYRGLPGGRFEEVGRELGFDLPAAPMGHNFGDLDNDGWLDLYLGTGWPQYEALMPNLMYRNDRGQRFVDVTYSGGFGHLQKGHGVAFADLDDDGDQEVFEQMGGAFPGDGYHDALYENPGSEGGWIKLYLEGTSSNRRALGARVRATVVTPNGRREIHRHVGPGGSFGSSPLHLHIGLGDAEQIESLTVRWPSATAEEQIVQGLAIGRSYRLVEGADPVDLSE